MKNLVKMGRPTNSPKNTMLHFRMDDKTIEQLNHCAGSLKITRSEVVRQGIKRIYEEIKK